MRVKPILRGIGWPLFDQAQVGIELCQSPRRPAHGRSHLRDQKAATVERKEVIGDAGLRCVRRKQEPGTTGVRNIKEKYAVLSAQQAEQAPAGQDVLVSGEV